MGDYSLHCSVSVVDVVVEIGGYKVLRGVTFTVEGGLTAIIGPNGAGKTTLLRALAGIIRPSKGYIRVCGLEPGRARKLLSYVPAFLQVDPYARVEDVLKAYMYDSTTNLNPESVLEAFGLGMLAGRRFNSLSGGEHKLVLIAGALARKPRLLLLDEPFSHLDLANQARIARMLREISRSTTVIMTVHEPLHASLAEKVGVLSSGELVAFGPPEDVLRKSLLEGVYKVNLVEAGLGLRKVLIPEL